MAQMPARSSAWRIRFEVSPAGALAAMVAVASAEGARPRVWPASCVTVFCTSMETQFTIGPPAGQGSASTVVKVNLLLLAAGASLISMSASKICPVDALKVVTVVAMMAPPRSQQSYLLVQPPWVRHGSFAGTTGAHRWVRKRIRLRLMLAGKNPIRRSPCSSGTTSGNKRADEDAPPQVAKPVRMARKHAGADT